jgi:hypothetical protein
VPRILISTSNCQLDGTGVESTNQSTNCGVSLALAVTRTLLTRDAACPLYLSVSVYLSICLSVCLQTGEKIRVDTTESKYLGRDTEANKK